MEFKNQVELFEYVWNTKPHICRNCWKAIIQPFTYCFPHLLPKGMYPEFKYNPNNIGLACSIDCHNKIDKRINWNKYTLKQMLEDWVKICRKTIFSLASDFENDIE